MRRGKTLVAVVALVLFVVTAPTKADDINGIIAGYVFDPDGRAVPNATVFAYPSPPGGYLALDLNGQATGIYNEHAIPLAPSAIRTTNKNGYFVFLGLLPDRYVLVATVKGLHDRGCRSSTQVHPNQISFVNLYLLSLTTHMDCFWPTDAR